MQHNYDDIRSRIAERPTWFDVNGVPRYGAFTPDSIPCIYANEAVLYEIQCQNCEERFLVAGHARSFWNSSEIADDIRTHRLHYGDPPRHDCTGDTMNCIDIRVIEYWRKNDDHEWARCPELEISIDDEREAR